MLFKPKKPSSHTAMDYILDERRSHQYSFISLKSLKRYFSAWLPEQDIDRMVERAGIGFMPRTGCSVEETRLQFLKRCEYSLVRALRDQSST